MEPTPPTPPTPPTAFHVNCPDCRKVHLRHVACREEDRRAAADEAEAEVLTAAGDKLTAATSVRDAAKRAQAEQRLERALEALKRAERRR